MIRIFTLTCLLAGILPAVDVLSLAEINGIDLSDAQNDQGWVCPVASDLNHLASNPSLSTDVEAFHAALATWPPAQATEPLPWTFALLNAAALVDLGRGSCEAEAAYVVLDMLIHDPRRDEILQAAATIALNRDGLTAATGLPALALTTTTPAPAIHTRIELLARKLVGRLLGTLPKKS